MTHVSSRSLRPKTSVMIKRNLVRASLDMDGLIIESLLTPTETLMIAKRLAMIQMLHDKKSTYVVSKTLNIGVATVLRYRRLLQAGHFKPILRALRKKNRSVLDIVELFLVGVMPARSFAHAKRIRAMRRGDI